MEGIKTFTESLIDRIFQLFLIFVSAWIIVALLFQLTFVILTFSGNTEIISTWSTKITHMLDGSFKNSPDNIWYVSDDHIWVEDVANNVKIGKLAGNRQLAFGVKNILEEYLQEQGKDLTPSAENKIKVEIVYLDVLTTKKNISVFHKNEEEVVVRMMGTLYKEGKKVKEVLVEESSSEISMSTLIVDEGGKFNQASLSNAIKKASGSLVTKLFE
jgi:hypothetical protein